MNNFLEDFFSLFFCVPKILHEFFFLGGIIFYSIFLGKKINEKIRSRVTSQNYFTWRKQEVCHTPALPFTLKSILRQKMNYGSSNMQNCNFQRNPLKETQNPSGYYNLITNLKFQHQPKYHLSKILIEK
jgi:hypothetical protein